MISSEAANFQLLCNPPMTTQERAEKNCAAKNHGLQMASDGVLEYPPHGCSPLLGGKNRKSNPLFLPLHPPLRWLEFVSICSGSHVQL